jgi:gas vesicle protein
MARRNSQDWEGWEGGGFLLGALAGALVGAGVALLLAPKTGAQIRSDISEGYNTAKDAAARRYRDIADKASQKLGYESKSTTGDRGPRDADFASRGVNGGTVPASDSFTTNPGTGYQS